MLVPSQPGYQFTSADVAQANVSPEQAGQIILAATASPNAVDPGSSVGVAALLAAILKSQKRSNCKYQPFPFNYDIWTRQQILAQNQLRQYLLIQNVGSGDLLVVFEEASIEPVDFSALADQATLVVQQTRAIRIVAGGSYEPLTPPQNAVTVFTLNTATFGLVIEGA